MYTWRWAMATRNLTRRFVEARNGAKNSRNLDSGGVGESVGNPVNETSAANLLESGELSSSGAGGSNWQDFKNALPPIWVDRVETVEEDISKIENRMKKLSSLHAKRLMVDFETDESKQEAEIGANTREITSIFRHAEGLLKQFGNQGDERQISKSEKTVRNNMQRSIAKKLQGLSGAFRSSQKEYLGRMRAQKLGETGGAKAMDFLSSSGGGADGQGGGFNNEQMQQLESSEDLVNQRDTEIVAIAQSIEELAQIFKELAVLVIDQGTILDRIDYNMEETLDHTKQGLVELTVAEKYQKQATPLKCIAVLILLNIVFMAIVIAKHQKKGKGDN